MIESSNYKPTNKRIYDYMKDANMDYLDDKALTYFQSTMVFQELFDVIDKVATSFKVLGVEKGDFVPICSPNFPQGVITFYALNKIGAIPDMLPVMASDEEFKHYLKDVPSKKIVLFRDLYPRLKSILAKTSIDKTLIVSPLTYIDTSKMTKISFKTKMENIKKEVQTSDIFNKSVMSWEKFLSISDNEPTVASAILNSNDTALLSHTGGSTGFPKAAEMTNENFNSMVEQFKSLNINIQRNYKILTILPLFINYGLCSNIHMPLSLGIETVIVPTFDANEAFDLLTKYQPNVFMCVADYFEKVMNDQRFDNVDLSFLKLVVYGGAPMDEQKKDMFNFWLAKHGALGVKIMNGYGMTESSATILTERNPIGEDSFKLMRLPDIKIKTVDPDTKLETSKGVAGELWASGPTIMKGYYNNPEETEQVLSYDEEGNKWLHTGDLAIINEDDSVKIIGRIKRMVPAIDVKNGNVAKIYPDNIENIISKSEYVEKAVVVCLKDSIRVNIPMAFIKLKEGVEKEKAMADIKEKCVELNVYSRPYHFFFVDTIKYNKSQKIDLPYYESLVNSDTLNEYSEETYDDKIKKTRK